MLKISHISKTFNPGTVNEKKALEDFSLELKKGDLPRSSVLTVPVNLHFLMRSAGISLQIPARLFWMEKILHLLRSMYVPKVSDACIRIR